MPRYSNYRPVETPNIFGSFLAGQEARQKNTLAEMDLQKRQNLNALSQDPNATPEQYVRAGDVQTGSALQGMQQQDEATKHQALTQFATLAKQALAIPDPMQRRAMIHQALQADHGRALSALGGDPVRAAQELESLPDDQLQQRMEQVAQFAPQVDANTQAQIDSRKTMDATNFTQQQQLAKEQHGYRLSEIGATNAQKPGRSIRTMTPAEITKAGLPPGTAAQIDESTGKIDVITKRDTTGVLSQKDAATAKNKLTAVKLAKQQLQRIKDAFAEGTGGVGPNAFGGYGGVQAMLPTVLGKKFDARVDQMRSTLTALTRTPGVGSMSDYETKLDQSKFPARGDREAVTADKIQGLEDMLATIESGYTSLLSGGAPEAASPAAPAAGGQGPVRVNSPQEAMALPPGTHFITPDGRTKVRP